MATCSDINRLLLRSWMDPCSAFLKNSHPSFLLRFSLLNRPRKMGYRTDRIVSRTILDTRNFALFVTPFNQASRKIVQLRLKTESCLQRESPTKQMPRELVYSVRFPREPGQFYVVEETTFSRRGNFTLLPPFSADLIIPANLASPFASEIGKHRVPPFLSSSSVRRRKNTVVLPFCGLLNAYSRETDYLQLASHIYMT